MKNIKEITLSIFAIIGFISIITAFNTQPQQNNLKYQTSSWYGKMMGPNLAQWHHHITDTKTGQIYKWHKKKGWEAVTEPIGN